MGEVSFFASHIAGSGNNNAMDTGKMDDISVVSALCERNDI